MVARGPIALGFFSGAPPVWPWLMESFRCSLLINCDISDTIHR
jgi:hypothetical protein